MQIMQYTWDEVKRLANLKKHRMDFADAEMVFEGMTLTYEDDRFAYNEQRFITIGLLHGVFVVIAHTEIEDVTRIFSMRKATNYERKTFVQAFGD